MTYDRLDELNRLALEIATANEVYEDLGNFKEKCASYRDCVCPPVRVILSVYGEHMDISAIDDADGQLLADITSRIEEYLANHITKLAAEFEEA